MKGRLARICSVILFAGLAACQTAQRYEGTTASVGTAGGAYPISRPSAELPGGGPLRSTAKIHIDLGMAYFEAGRYGVALDEGRVSIAYDKTYAPGYQLLGMVYSALEQPGEARKNFEEAMRLAPGDPDIANAYGWFLCSQNQEQEGIARLQQAARNPYYPTPTRAWTNLGLCYLHLKNDEQAEQNFLRAIEARSDNAQAVFNLALLAYRRAAYVRTRELLTTLHKQIKPTAETIWLALRAEHQLGNRIEEGRYGAQLKKDFPASNEYQAFLQGRFE